MAEGPERIGGEALGSGEAHHLQAFAREVGLNAESERRREWERARGRWHTGPRKALDRRIGGWERRRAKDAAREQQHEKTAGVAADRCDTRWRTPQDVGWDIRESDVPRRFRGDTWDDVACGFFIGGVVAVGRQ